MTVVPELTAPQHGERVGMGGGGAAYNRWGTSSRKIGGKSKVASCIEPDEEGERVAKSTELEPRMVRIFKQNQFGGHTGLRR